MRIAAVRNLRANQLLRQILGLAADFRTRRRFEKHPPFNAAQSKKTYGGLAQVIDQAAVRRRRQTQKEWIRVN